RDRVVQGPGPQREGQGAGCRSDGARISAGSGTQQGQHEGLTRDCRRAQLTASGTNHTIKERMMFENFDWIQAIRTSPVMLVILSCSVLTLGFALERLLYYGARGGISKRALHETIERARRGEAKEAAFACGTMKHPFGPVAAELLRSIHLPPDHQEERMSIALSEQRLLLERNLGF